MGFALWKCSNRINTHTQVMAVEPPNTASSFQAGAAVPRAGGGSGGSGTDQH